MAKKTQKIEAAPAKTTKTTAKKAPEGYASRDAIRAAEAAVRAGTFGASGNESGRPPRGLRAADGTKAGGLYGMLASVLAEVGKALSIPELVKAAGDRLGSVDPTYQTLPRRVGEFFREARNRSRGLGPKAAPFAPYRAPGRPGGVVYGPATADGGPTLIYSATAEKVSPFGSVTAPPSKATKAPATKAKGSKAPASV